MLKYVGWRKRTINQPIEVPRKDFVSAVNQYEFMQRKTFEKKGKRKLLK